MYNKTARSNRIDRRGGYYGGSIQYHRLKTERRTPSRNARFRNSRVRSQNHSINHRKSVVVSKEKTKKRGDLQLRLRNDNETGYKWREGSQRPKPRRNKSIGMVNLRYQRQRTKEFRRSISPNGEYTRGVSQSAHKYRFGNSIRKSKTQRVHSYHRLSVISPLILHSPKQPLDPRGRLT